MSDDFEKLSLKDLMTDDRDDIEQTHNTELIQPESVLSAAEVAAADNTDDDDDTATVDNSAPILPSSSGELLNVYCLEILSTCVFSSLLSGHMDAKDRCCTSTPSRQNEMLLSTPEQ